MDVVVLLSWCVCVLMPLCLYACRLNGYHEHIETPKSSGVGVRRHKCARCVSRTSVTDDGVKRTIETFFVRGQVGTQITRKRCKVSLCKKCWPVWHGLMALSRPSQSPRGGSRSRCRLDVDNMSSLVHERGKQVVTTTSPHRFTDIVSATPSLVLCLGSWVGQTPRSARSNANSPNTPCREARHAFSIHSALRRNIPADDAVPY